MKTQSTISLSLAVGTLVLAAACSDSDYHFIGPAIPDVIHGNGTVVEQTRSVSSITRINHRGVGDLYIRQGVREELRIQAEENLMDYLWTEVQAGELLIWKDGVTLVNTHPIEYHLTVVDLDRVALTGAGLIRGSDLDTGPLALRLTGVGTVEFVNLNAPRVEIDSSGVGDVLVSGSVQEQTIALGMWGGYDGRDLASTLADVLVENGGTATVRVRDHLKVTINGTGNVFYIGDPIVESSIIGSGRVEKIGS